MASVIHAALWERNRRLRELGCEYEDLIEVVRAGVAGRAGCTANDPISAPGYEAWRLGTRCLRERFLRKEGWESDNTLNIESIVHRERGIRISFVNADEGTGMPLKSPRNRTPKGVATESVAEGNSSSVDPFLVSRTPLSQQGLRHGTCACSMTGHRFVRSSPGPSSSPQGTL